MKSLKTVMITGGAGTIGTAVARLFSDQGWHVLLVDRNQDSIKELATMLPNCSWASVNLVDPVAVEKLFQEYADTLTSVVMAAGLEGPVGFLEDCSDIDFFKVMEANVTTVWYGLKNSLRIFKAKNSGTVVVLSSISGVTAAPLLSAYSASKHAVIGLVKTAAREAARYGVRINAVSPGPVLSEMMDRIDNDMAKNFPERRSGANNASNFVPVNRYATADEVANAIYFLSSDSSTYCTGTTLMVDGGLTCK